MNVPHIVLLLSLAGVAASCSSGALPGGEVCAPGAQVACACPGGGTGAQICTADGAGYGTCVGCASSVGGGLTCEVNPGMAGHQCESYGGAAGVTSCPAGTNVAACPAAGAVGTCTVSVGGYSASITYYADGGYTPSAAQAGCTAAHGTWGGGTLGGVGPICDVGAGTSGHECVAYPPGAGVTTCPSGTPVTTCPSTNRLGTCTVASGGYKVSATYYSDGGLTAATAQMACTAANGSWSP